MPRPKANQDQQLLAYQLHKDGYGPTAILQKLREEFGDENTVSPRTVATWVKGFKQRTHSLDAPFEWHRMEEYGLPWESSEYLLTMWRGYKERTGSSAPLRVRSYPTVRQVRWWWRVHNAALDLGDTEVIEFAQRFVARELAHDVLGEPMDTSDLEAWLAYRGWEERPEFTSVGTDRYWWALKRGFIPPLRSLDDERAAVYGVAKRTGNFRDAMLSMESFGTAPSHRELRAARQRAIQEGIQQPPIQPGTRAAPADHTDPNQGTQEAG